MQVILEIGLCFPFADEDRRILIRSINVESKVQASLYVLNWFEQPTDSLKQLCPIIWIDGNSCGIDDHFDSFPS